MNHRSKPVVLVSCVACSLSASMALAHPGHTEPEATTAAAGEQPAGQPSGPNGGNPRNGRPAPMEAIELPEPVATISIEGESRVIRANGLPNHETGTFPNRDNPNAIRPQQFEYKLPLVPTMLDEPQTARPEFGIGVNGVIFDAGTAEYWTPQQDRAFGGGSEWNYEALGGGVPLGLDKNNAHVQPSGKYHYHGVPTGLIESLAGEAGTQRMIHIGWAFDGFPIYGPWGYSDAANAQSEPRELTSSYQLKPGNRPERPEGPGGEYDGTFGADYEYVAGSGDLDECNGRFGVTPEYPAGTYYYIVSEKFPAVPRLWHGAVSEANRPQRPNANQRPEPGQNPAARDRGNRPMPRP
jgi:hypothetical protein